MLRLLCGTHAGLGWREWTVDAGRGPCGVPVMVTMGTVTGVEEEMVTGIWMGQAELLKN